MLFNQCNVLDKHSRHKIGVVYVRPTRGKKPLKACQVAMKLTEVHEGLQMKRRLVALLQLVDSLSSEMVKLKRKHNASERQKIGLLIKCALHKTTKQTSELCPVCMGPLCEDDLEARCGHVFHKKCIVNWLSRSNTCPMCRSEVYDGGKA